MRKPPKDAVDRLIYLTDAIEEAAATNNHRYIRVTTRDGKLMRALVKWLVDPQREWNRKAGR